MLFIYLNGLSIKTTTVEHEPAFTVEQSRQHRGILPGGHTKNLFVKDKKSRHFLIVARESARIDLKRLHETIGGSGRVSFGNAQALMEMLGVEPGSVCVFAAINDTQKAVTVVLDKGLLEHETIHAHPLRNTMTTAIARADLLRFLASIDHAPLILNLPEPVEQHNHAET